MEKKLVLDKQWKIIKQNYSITRFMGEGSYGEVVKARHRTTREVVAIKMLKFNFNNIHLIRNVIRELAILRQLTMMDNNYFTITLKELVVPVDIETEAGLKKLNHLFIVTEFVETDMQKLI